MEILKRNVSMREEDIRAILKFDIKQLRAVCSLLEGGWRWRRKGCGLQLLVQLKRDLLIKERLMAEEREDGRALKVPYYFVNYRSLINVTKYKIDHMRFDPCPPAPGPQRGSRGRAGGSWSRRTRRRRIGRPTDASAAPSPSPTWT